MNLIVNIIKYFVDRKQEQENACLLLQNEIVTEKQELINIAENFIDHGIASYESQLTICKVLADKSLRYERSFRKCVSYPEYLNLTRSFQELVAEYSKRTNDFRLLQKEYENRLKQEISHGYEVIGNIEGRSLDHNQMAAIVKDPDNHLVLAGAGTGKTTTIVGKVKYLLYSKACHEKEILVLSFTSAAAKEMKDRLSSEILADISVSTFHKLGLDIIRKVQGKSPLIYQESTLKFIFEQLKECVKDDDYKNKLIHYLLFGQVNEKSEFDFNSIEEYQDYLEVNPPTTIKNERVKSYGEMEIANFLNQHGIIYEYEASYCVDTRTAEYGQYHPDFYLPDYNFYIEYYGINRNGEVPEYFEGKHGRSATELYQESMEWKKNIHETNDTTLIECFAYEHLEGKLIDSLAHNLISHGVDLEEVDLDVLFGEMESTKMQQLQNFSELLQTILMLTKSNQYSIEDLIKLCEVERIGRQSLLVELFAPIFFAYEKMLKDKGAIDFSDMINKATGYVTKGEYQHQYKYIIIDEYQDISKAQYRLLQAMRLSRDYKLFCVGDDWQSIYRFAGSDIGYILNFKKHWGACEISTIETTYRFSQRLIEISSGFITKNPNQISKRINSHLESEKLVLGEIEGYNETLAIEFMVEKIKDLPVNSTVFFIGRYQFDVEMLRGNPNLDVRYDNVAKTIKVAMTGREDLNMSFYTAHRSKGLQSDYVFIINNRNRGMGFPSKVQNAPLIELLLEQADNYKFAEERRLFYVAMTRARKKVYLVTAKNNLSIFAGELKEKYQTEMRKEAFACPVCSAPLVKRSGKYGDFFGCSNYSKTGCKYTRKVQSRQ